MFACKHQLYQTGYNTRAMSDNTSRSNSDLPSTDWIPIRGAGTNRLLCRFDPYRELLEFKRRGEVIVVDLRRYRPRWPADEWTPYESMDTP